MNDELTPAETNSLRYMQLLERYSPVCRCVLCKILKGYKENPLTRKPEMRPGNLTVAEEGSLRFQALEAAYTDWQNCRVGVLMELLTSKGDNQEWVY